MGAISERIPHPTTEVGALVGGRYRIVEEIGSGGFGRVFRAEHLTLGRSVAVKLLSGTVGRTSSANARFRREASAAGRLEHPNCVEVIDFAEGDDDKLYMVMELLEGTPLTDVVKAGPIDPKRALGIARHVLAGLGHAHEQGVVHRDVKPGNIILVEHDGDSDFAKLLDFGIAKVIDAANAEGENLTQAGFAIGSPTYMSPEQATAAVLDGRSDLYSVSVVLFELLTGRPPFADDDKLSLLGKHISQPAPRLADVLGSPIEPALQRLLDDGMAKQSKHRIATAAEYIARIDAILSPETVATVSLPRRGERRAPWRERGSLLKAIGVVAAILFACLGVLAFGTTGASPETTVATSVAPAAEAEPVEDAVVDELAEIASMINDKRYGAAKRALIARDKTGINKDARVPLWLGHLYIRDMWWADAFAAYKRAFELDPDMREDERVIAGAIRSLMSQRRPGLGERFLREEIGAAAIPQLRAASKESSSASIRRRSRNLMRKLERR